MEKGLSQKRRRQGTDLISSIGSTQVVELPRCFESRFLSVGIHGGLDRWSCQVQKESQRFEPNWNVVRGTPARTLRGHFVSHGFFLLVPAQRNLQTVASAQAALFSFHDLRWLVERTVIIFGKDSAGALLSV